MENKYAIAVVLASKENQWLFGRRSLNVLEYKNFWSLPSCIVEKKEYDDIVRLGIVPPSAQEKISDKCFGEPLSIDLRFLRAGIRQRCDYRLNMTLVGGKVAGLPSPARDKYTEFCFFDILDVLQRQNFQVGTCISLLIQQMIEHGELDSALNYLEISPEIAESGLPLNEFSSEELWLRALPNYLLLKAGESGSDGSLIRGYTIDRYLEKYMKCVNLRETILDLGCGGGDLVCNMTTKGYQALGVDLFPDPINRYADGHQKIDLRKCRAQDIHQIIEPGSVSQVIMNLVAQWIDNLENVAMSIKKVIQRGGRVLVTIVPPEFSKNGSWNFVDGDYNWVVREPLRRKPFLVMINRTVGPVRYYPRTTPEYISSFTRSGFLCSNSEYIYIDTMLNDDEINTLYMKRPDLRRHSKIPVFLVLEFVSI